MSPACRPAAEFYTNVNVYGVPWIIHAKKGWPNFNEFAMESTFQLTRNCKSHAPAPIQLLALINTTRCCNLSIRTEFGVECWNSYTNNYTRPVAMYVTCTNACLYTNDEGFRIRCGFIHFQDMSPIRPITPGSVTTR